MKFKWFFLLIPVLLLVGLIPAASGQEDAISETQLLSRHLQNLSKEDLSYQLRSIIPVSPQTETREITQLSKSGNEEQMRDYLQNYWVEQDSIVPYQALLSYNSRVSEVNEMFSSNMYEGFETDRGRVYLQYGPPNHASGAVHEPGAFPYQIWQYYVVGNQRNVKFVFYNPFLVGNNYELIHSEASGEIRNPNWQNQIFRRTDKHGGRW